MRCDSTPRIGLDRRPWSEWPAGPPGQPATAYPHGHHLGDALPKLRGLADYAQRHGHHYQRIDAVAKVGDTLRVLDLTEPSVRAAVAAATDATTLDRSDHATDY